MVERRRVAFIRFIMIAKAGEGRKNWVNIFHILRIDEYLLLYTAFPLNLWQKAMDFLIKNSHSICFSSGDFFLFSERFFFFPNGD